MYSKKRTAQGKGYTIPPHKRCDRGDIIGRRLMSQRVWSSGDGDPQIPGTRNRSCSRKSYHLQSHLGQESSASRPGPQPVLLFPNSCCQNENHCHRGCQSAQTLLLSLWKNFLSIWL